jgi:hypothetical protein
MAACGVVSVLILLLIQFWMRLCGRSFSLLYRLPQNHFDLTIDAAQLILRPRLKFSPERGIDAH